MANLEIVISAINEASDELSTVKDDIAGVGTSSEDAKQPTKDFGDTLTTALGAATVIAAGIAAVAEGITAVYDAAKEAAALDFATMQFDNLSVSIGTTAKVLMTDMHQASQGMIADSDLIAGASMAIATGVAKSGDEVVLLAKYAADLNVPFSNLVDAVDGTGTALQNMGVDISGVRDRAKELIDLGWDKNTAQVAANMEALEQHVTKVGSAADSELANFQKADAVLKNIGDNAKESTLGLGGFFAGLAYNAGTVVEAKQNFSSLRDELKDTGQWTTDFQSRYEAATGALGIVTNWDAFNSLLGDMGAAADGAAGSVDAATGAIETLNSTELEDKEAIAKFEVDDKEVRDYEPPDKEAIVKYTVSGGGGGGTAYYQAVGGAVYGGNPYTWQEYGYKGELFVPSSNGFVMSRADAERALAKALTGGGAAADPDAIGRAVAKALSGVTKGNQSGNVYNLTMPTSSNPADVRTAFELMEAWA